MRHRARLLIAVTVLACAPGAAADVNGGRARAAAAALASSFHSRHAGLYLETGRDGRIAYAWPYSQAVAAAIAVASLPDATRAERRAAAAGVAGFAYYRRGLVYGSSPRGDVFVDDNEWIALDLLDWSALSHSGRALETARRLYAFAIEEWDGSAGGPCPGGVYWTRRRPNRDRAAVTTAAGALLGLRLAELTGPQPSYLWWSRRMLDWLDRCLARPDGLYANAVGPDGGTDGNEWSYNQGLVIGALVLEARAGDTSALPRAEALAAASLRFLEPTTIGLEPPPFVAVLARDLLLLGATDGDPRWRAAVQAYADAAWMTARDPLTGVFLFGGRQGTLLEQAALTQIYALLAAPIVTAGL
jgi:hypothetical protein